MELKRNSLPLYIEYYIPIVDPSDEFIENLTIGQFQEKLSLRIHGFRNAREYLGLLTDDQYRHMVPLLLVADVAARKPDVENGVFAKTRKHVPRCSCIPYTTMPERHEWQRLLDMGAIENREDIVNRLEDNSEDRLLEVLQEKITRFQKSDDFKRITEFNKYLSDIGSTDINEWTTLIETAHGTKESECLICRRNMSGPSQPIRIQPSPVVNCFDEETTRRFLTNKMIEPNSWLGRLLYRDKLWFLLRLLVEDRVRYLLTYLYKWDHSFRDVFDQLTIPTDTDGWRIVACVYEELRLLYSGKLQKEPTWTTQNK